MFSNFLKNLSILKKFLFINLFFFTIIGLFTFLYLKNVQPNLIKKKSSNHIEVINNTIDNLSRLNVKFVEEDIRKFLFSTRFLFQNLDRVIFFDDEMNIIGDTDTLDLDPRAFSSRLDTVELEILSEKKNKEITEKKNINIGKKNAVSLKDILFDYAESKKYGIPFTFTEEGFNKFKLTTIKKNIKCEKMFRKDHKYDLMIPIKYNFLKPVKFKGSCIFIHLTNNFKATAGCIAMKKNDFLVMLKLVDKQTKINIY